MENNDTFKKENINTLVRLFGDKKVWINWTLEPKKGKDGKNEVTPDGSLKMTKVPRRLNGQLAASDDPTSWVTYADAFSVKDKFSGTGIVFEPSLNILGVDFDHCVTDGKVSDSRINAFLVASGTYSEISQSGTGLHVFFQTTEAFKPIANRRPAKGFLDLPDSEIYSWGRYFTFTGQPWGDEKDVKMVTPDEINALLSVLGYPWGKGESVPSQPYQTSISPFSDDQDLLDKMFSSKKGAKIRALYEGDTSEHGDNLSVADLALCAHLAFWTDKDKERMRKMWVASPLAAREKTQKRVAYQNMTLDKAIDGCTEGYKSSIMIPYPSLMSNATAEVDNVSESTISLAAGEVHIEEPIQEEVDIAVLFQKNKTTATYRLAQYIKNKYSIITIGEKEREIYVYQNGLYARAENSIIFPEIQRVLGEQVNKNAKNETIHKIWDSTSFPRDIFTSADVRFIPLSNGVYDRETGDLLPHSPDYRFTFQLPIKYDKDATCSKTEAFLHSILTDEQYTTMVEWLGYYFLRKYSFKKALIIVGEKDSGKTTLLTLITNLLGTANISGVPLQKMSSDKFAAVQLDGKHANIYDELSVKDIMDTGPFKMATGSSLMHGEFKFGNSFGFVNFAKMTFACNKMPDVKDMDDDAYFGRWLLVRLEKKIEKKISDFAETITTEEERSGLFNLAMGGLDKLLKQGKFTHEEDSIDTKLEMMKSGSSIVSFTVERLEQKDGAEMTVEEMYETYCDFCSEKKAAIETKDMFAKKLPFCISYAADGLVTSMTAKGMKRVRGWRNVTLKPLEENKEMEEVFKAL
jgi:putative DNA primase/helicase